MSPIRNVVVYMSDGVRWDSLPDEISEMGLTCRTIAASTHTPTAIASMLTGQYLPTHGIRGFTDRLAEDQWTILDEFPHTGLSDSAGNFNNEIYGFLFDRYDSVPLAKIEEPFAWFMRDAGGHAPYSEFDETLQTEESVNSYLAENAGDNEQLRTDYEAGIESSVERFHRFVLDPLRERGILDETLVLFASDHGQMLGEYGHVGESYPACPEIVYVPTTFIHPDIDDSNHDGIFRHVDIPATIGGFLDEDIDTLSTAGTDVVNGDIAPEYGLNFYDRPYPSVIGDFRYSVESVWDQNGGYAFVTSDTWSNLKLFGGLLAMIPAGKQIRRSRNLEGFKLLFRREQTWLNPGFSMEEARRRLDDVEQTYDTDGVDMDAETKDNLQDLGYL
ncbi:sulfatase-like hydrolase/transferase [Halomicrobium sp. IBSBa]|nr:sulfatase-like hydrolase/transferase [Halomicrobium sp. IBSBa]